MKTITYDPAIYKLAPLIPSNEMNDAPEIGVGAPDYCYEQYLASTEECDEIYRAMLTAVPDALPGVVTHSGEPYAWLLIDQGCRAPDDCEDYERVEIASEMFQGDLSRFVAAGRATGLYTHPAPDAKTIITATLEACMLVICDKYSATPNLDNARDIIVGECYDAIRTLSPQDILDGLK